MTDVFTKEKRSWLMSRVRSKGSRIERIMEAQFVKKGFSFETNCKDLPGTPDFVFWEKKVAVFVDSEFWHGYRMGPRRLGRYPPFWRQKILQNKVRDTKVNNQLEKLGWTVVRFWGKEVLGNPEVCSGKVETTLA